jgi:hypothetical protein
MLRVARGRPVREIDDEVRVERFVRSMLLLGVLLIAAGVLYVAWYVLAP